MKRETFERENTVSFSLSLMFFCFQNKKTIIY